MEHFQKGKAYESSHIRYVWRYFEGFGELADMLAGR